MIGGKGFQPLTTLKLWKESTRSAIAATGRTVKIAAISALRSSAFKRTDSLGRPNASAATFAALDAAAAAAAVVRLLSSKAAKARSCAAETVLVFIVFDSDFAGIPSGGIGGNCPRQANNPRFAFDCQI